MSEHQTAYDANDIQVLEGLEAVRERPGMYIGSTDTKGLHHLVYEVVDNSIDEAMEGHCDEIEVTIHEDNSISVSDDGRGIPVDTHAEKNKSAVEVILTVLHAGGKFDNKSYKASGGLHGVGISVVNALTERLEVQVKRDDHVYEHAFERGVPQQSLKTVRELEDDEPTGTTIHFWPDEAIFDTTTYSYDTLEKRLRQLAFLNPGVSITLTDERDNDRQGSFHYEGGIREYVDYLNDARDALHDTIYLNGGEEIDTGYVDVEIALQATDSPQGNIYSFANNIHTHNGGRHLTGFKTALTRIVNQYGNDNGMLGEIDGNLSGEDIRDGMTAVISIKHPDPQFEGQTKTTLGNSEVRGIVEQTMSDGLNTHFEENPDEAKVIVGNAVQAAKARKAAEKAQELTRRKSKLNSTTLPGKLADCQNQSAKDTEIFITEGDSAGGSAKQARDNAFQAVMPIKGKIINVEKHRLDRVLENDEIRAMVHAIGTGIGDEFDMDDLRYERIVLFTDADVDGAHIRTLLLTFFFRYMRPLIEEGHIYAAQPPLYRIRYRGETYDAMTEDDREQIIAEKCNGNPTQIQRFKGLGEMNPKQLWEATMNPENRILKRITIDDAAEADHIFSVLMGDDVKPRREFISNNAEDANFVDI